MRSSSELPDDVGTVFITNVPNAPLQILGRRGPTGELFCGSVYVPKTGADKLPGDEDLAAMLEGCPVNVEIISGAEAQRAIAEVARERAQPVFPAFVFHRRRHIELEAGLILAGTLFVDIPKDDKRVTDIVGAIVQQLIKTVGSQPALSEAVGWNGGVRPPNAVDADDEKIMRPWIERSRCIAVRVDPRADGDIHLDSEILAQMGPPDTRH